MDHYRALSRICFETKRYSDCTVICSDGIEIPIHRIALAFFSDLFDTLFRLALTDRNSNTKIEIEDIDGATMNEVLRFIYVEEVENLKELAPKIYYGAKKYDLSMLEDICVEFMINNLCIENAVEYFLVAEKFKIQNLLHRCTLFIKQNLEGVSKDKNWNQLDTKKFMMQ